MAMSRNIDISGASSSGSARNLRLHPWRDGVDHCQRVVEMTMDGVEDGLVASVDLCFHETDYVPGSSSKMDLTSLMESIGRLPRLESLIIRMTMASSEPFQLSHSIPPVTALTSVLSSDAAFCINSNHRRLAYLTLIGLPLLADDLDMNGLVEAVRIHPSLHSVVMKECQFTSTRHLDLLRSALLHQRSKPMKHCDFLDNRIVDVTRLEGEDDNTTPWYQSLFALCLFPFGVCILYFIVLWLEQQGMWDLEPIVSVLRQVYSQILSREDTIVQPEKKKWLGRFFQKR